MAENLSFVSQVKTVLGIYDTPDPTRVLGMDVSHWTGVVDWQKAKDAGIKFAIIKFMNGVSLTKYAVENYHGAKDAGILVGAYAWLYRSANISAGRQARAYLAMLKEYPVDLPPVVDFEWTTWNGAPSNPNIDDLYGFVAPFEQGYGAKPMIYTAPGYWKQYGIIAPSWKQYPLWLAQYRVTAPDVVLPWGDCKIWQFTPNGKGADYGQPSTSKSADLNYWQGTLEQLYAFCNKTPPVVIEPPPVEPPIVIPLSKKAEAVIVVKSINTRKIPSVTGEIVTPSVKLNEHIEVLATVKDVDGNTWAQIGTERWVCIVYGGVEWALFLGLWRNLNDNELPMSIRPPRSYGGKDRHPRGLPQANKMQGGRGGFVLSPDFDALVRSINTLDAMTYLLRMDSGWSNTKQYPGVEPIIFGGNIANVVDIEVTNKGTRLYLDTFHNDDKPPYDWRDTTKVHRFSVVYDNDGHHAWGSDGPAGMVYTLLIANKGERLWMDKKFMIKV